MSDELNKIDNLPADATMSEIIAKINEIINQINEVWNPDAHTD